MTHIFVALTICGLSVAIALLSAYITNTIKPSGIWWALLFALIVFVIWLATEQP